MAVCTSTGYLLGLSLIAAEETGLFTVAKAGKVRLARLGTSELRSFMSWRWEKPMANDFLKLLFLQDVLTGRYIPPPRVLRASLNRFTCSD